MSEKTVVFVVVCIIIVVLGIGLAEIFVFKTRSQQAPTETTMINGILYSTKPTPYGIFILGFLNCSVMANCKRNQECAGYCSPANRHLGTLRQIPAALLKWLDPHRLVETL